MKRLVVVPSGWECTLAECPSGLFIHDGILCLKTDYGQMVCVDENPKNRIWKIDESGVDAYVVASGEYFCGGVCGKEKRK